MEHLGSSLRDWSFSQHRSQLPRGKKQKFPVLLRPGFVSLRTSSLWSKQSSPSNPFSQFSSVAQSCPTLFDPMGLQHARPPCPSPTPGVHSDSCPFSWSQQWHRTGKDQSLPQFPRRVIPRNVLTIGQLHSSPRLVRSCLKSYMLGFSIL